MTESIERGWHSERTAHAYEEYAQAHSMYKVTAHDLVAIAEIAPGMTVVDVACGTGIVTEAILGRLGETGSVIGVDMSREMLAVAGEKIQAANVAFVQSPAERLNEGIEATADVAVCNSAFWQIRMSEALTALGIVLKANGRFVFNLPHGFFRFTAEDAPVSSSPSLYQLMLDIATREYGSTPPERLRQRRPLDFALVKCAIEKSGFALASYQTITYQKPVEVTLAFLRIPIMLESRLPGLPEAARIAILEKAWAQYEKTNVPLADTWTYFVTENRTNAA